ncbi:hypothetical protein [Streptomyces longisporoflavus]|uniref:Uncharacterized protein n=1 Tax=Streptomyces longisporoflavus TaxID=28044 RepID=A0ABW7R2T5_9ACTN
MQITVAVHQAAVNVGGTGDPGNADLLAGGSQLVASEGFEHSVSSTVGVSDPRSGQVVR